MMRTSLCLRVGVDLQGEAQGLSLHDIPRIFGQGDPQGHLHGIPCRYRDQIGRPPLVIGQCAQLCGVNLGSHSADDLDVTRKDEVIRGADQ